jgi:hypothetical protein
MRELYAAELCGDDGSSNDDARAVVQDWADRHTQGEVAIEEASDGSVLWTLTQPDDDDPHLGWRSEVALGPPSALLRVMVRVRIHSVDAAAVAPVSYEFGTPAVVRTILRAATVTDAGERVLPGHVELGASDVPALVAWLESPERRLPVVVVSRTMDAGSTLVDSNSLAKEVAGIAHVRVLSSSAAAWALTSAVGQPMSVWGGAVRIYFPGFASTDDPRGHRYWVANVVNNGLISRVRGWLGTLSASRTPEHPVHGRLRADRLQRLKDASADGEMLYEFIEVLEAEAEQQKQEIADLQSRAVQLERELEAKDGELESVKQSFAEVSRAVAPTSAPAAAGDLDAPLTVAAALDAVEELLANRYYRKKVVITPQALAAGRAFSDYKRPEELLRAVQCVMEAAVLVFEKRLGESPGEYFNRRGFGYAATPTPHLKVDESTSPDQCLRIYWTADDDSRLWTIDHIGRHR